MKLYAGLPLVLKRSIFFYRYGVFLGTFYFHFAKPRGSTKQRLRYTATGIFLLFFWLASKDIGSHLI